jgi:hypothetical protein
MNTYSVREMVKLGLTKQDGRPGSEAEIGNKVKRKNTKLEQGDLVKYENKVGYIYWIARDVINIKISETEFIYVREFYKVFKLNKFRRDGKIY